MNSTTESASVKRSPGRSIFWFIVAVLGLIFGLAILNLAGGATDLGGGEKALRIIFGIVWFTVCLGAMVYNVLNWSAYSRSKKNREAPTAEKTTEGPARERTEDRVDFEARLRKLESLRKDGLVSEDEYQRKRDEFLREKW